MKCSYKQVEVKSHEVSLPQGTLATGSCLLPSSLSLKQRDISTLWTVTLCAPVSFQHFKYQSSSNQIRASDEFLFWYCKRQLWHIFLNILFSILNSKSFLNPQILTLLSLKKNSKQGFSIFLLRNPFVTI